MVGWLHAMRLENDIQIMRVSLNKLRYFELINQSKRKKRKKKECVVVWCVWCGRQDVSLHYFIREQTQSRGEKKKKEDVKKKKKEREKEVSLNARKDDSTVFFCE